MAAVCRRFDVYGFERRTASDGPGVFLVCDVLLYGVSPTCLEVGRKRLVGRGKICIRTS